MRAEALRFLRLVVLGATFGAALAPGHAWAQSRPPVRIGVLTESWGATPATAGLRDGLHALGYREDEHFHVGVRFTRGDLRALPAAARDLLDAGSDVIFATSANAAAAAQQATSVKPIVFAEVVGDPVKLGLVQSFARPGGNVTGVSTLTVELTAKRLEIFRELVPGLRRVLLLYDPSDLVAAASAELHRNAARQLGLVLTERTARTQDEARTVLARLRRSDLDGILGPPSGVSLNIPGEVFEFAERHQIPSLFIAAFWVERGALASYGPDFYDSGRQAARLVAKIMRGEAPATIPAEMNSRIEFAINLKTARRLGLQPVPALLQRAHRIIE